MYSLNAIQIISTLVKSSHLVHVQVKSSVKSERYTCKKQTYISPLYLYRIPKAQ